jgi:hypothetical protein
MTETPPRQPRTKHPAVGARIAATGISAASMLAIVAALGSASAQAEVEAFVSPVTFEAPLTAAPIPVPVGDPTQPLVADTAATNPVAASAGASAAPPAPAVAPAAATPTVAAAPVAAAPALSAAPAPAPTPAPAAAPVQLTPTPVVKVVPAAPAPAVAAPAAPPPPAAKTKGSG